MIVFDRAANIYSTEPVNNTHFFDKFTVLRDIAESGSLSVVLYHFWVVAKKQ